MQRWGFAGRRSLFLVQIVIGILILFKQKEKNRLEIKGQVEINAVKELNSGCEEPVCLKMYFPDTAYSHKKLRLGVLICYLFQAKQ
jgi:hypothetical protein